MDTPFFGGSYESFSSNLANDRCMNLYPEVVETKQGKAIGGLYTTPGLRAWATFGSGPIRGLASAMGQNKLVAVSGNTVGTIDMNGVQATLGTLATTSGPVGILTNATQVFVCDGLNGWVYSGGLWQKTPLVMPAVACQQDGFGLVNQVGTNQVWQSNLNDFSTWDGLNFTSVDAEPSPVVGMVDLFRQVWFLKQGSCEIWNNAGLNGFAFQRMQGAFLEQGCIAQASVANAGDRILWLGQDARGQGVVYSTHGYQAARVSTHAVEYAIATYGVISDAVAYCYQQAGHMFYVLTFPSGNATWVYDVHLGLWHERGEYANGQYARHDGNCCTYFNGNTFVGSASSGQLYVYDISYPTDDLTPLPQFNPKRWSRRWRATKDAVMQPIRYDSLHVDMQIQPPPGHVEFNQERDDNLSIAGDLTSATTFIPVYFAYTITGTFSPLAVSITSGSLPPGLSVSPSGVVTGTPTQGGTFSWVATVTDALGATESVPNTCLVKPMTLYAVGNGSTPISFPASTLDGSSWVPATTSTGVVLDSVCGHFGVYLASYATSGPPSLLRSTDGTNWTAPTVPFPCGGAVCYGNGLFVFGTFPGGTDACKIYTSVDGLNWTLQTTPYAPSIGRIQYINGQFVGCCIQGALIISSDGVTWRVVSLPGGQTNEDIYWSGTYYMVVGNRACFISQDLINFTSVSSTFNLGECVAFFKGQWVVGNSTGTVWTSGNNGGSWTQISGLSWAGGEGMIVVAFDKIMIPAPSSGIIASSDLVNWTTVTAGLPPAPVIAFGVITA